MYEILAYIKLSAENSLRMIYPRGLNKVLKNSGKFAEYIKQLVEHWAVPASKCCDYNNDEYTSLIVNSY